MKYKGNSVTTQRIKIKTKKVKEVLNPITNEIHNIATQDVEKVTRSLTVPDWHLFLVMKKPSSQEDFFSLCTGFLDDFVTKKLSTKEIITNYYKKLEIPGLKGLENADISNKSVFGDFLMPFIKKISYCRNSCGFMYIFYLPLLSKSFGINIKVRKRFLVLNVNKMYYSELLFPYHNDLEKKEDKSKKKTFVDLKYKSFFDIKTRYLFVLIEKIEKTVKKETKSEESSIPVKESLEPTKTQGIKDDFSIPIDDSYMYDVVI